MSQLGWTLNEDNARVFRAHKYQKAGATALEPILDPFFTFVASLVPDWITPNAITMAGAALNIATMSYCVFLDPTFSAHSRPVWLGMIAGFGGMLAMLMDAIDGKHARNTKQSSPVGHWLDHGFDAMTLVFQVTYGNFALNSLQNMWLIVTIGCMQSHWNSVWIEKRLTGKLRFPVVADLEGGTFVFLINTCNRFLPSWRAFTLGTVFVVPVLDLVMPGYAVIVSGSLCISVSFILSSNVKVYQHWVAQGKPSGYWYDCMYAWVPNFINIFMHAWIYVNCDNFTSSFGWSYVWIFSEGALFCVLVCRMLIQDLCDVDYDRRGYWLTLPLCLIVANEAYLRDAGWGLQLDTTTLMHYHMWFYIAFYFYTMFIVYFQILYQFTEKALKTSDKSLRRDSVSGSRRANQRNSNKKSSKKSKTKSKESPLPTPTSASKAKSTSKKRKSSKKKSRKSAGK